LVVDGQVRATAIGKPRTAKELIHTQIGQTEFVRENQPLTITERIALAEILKETIGATSAADVATALPALLDRLTSLSASAGGGAPLPTPPDPPLLHELRALGGVAQLRRAYEVRDQLRDWFREWTDLKAKAATRGPKWHRLQDLLKHGGALPQIAEIRHQTNAIQTDRTLLLDPDPVTPLIQSATDALRTALQDARGRQVTARERQVEALHATSEWQKLPDEQWKNLLAKEGLGVVPGIEIGTEEQLLKSLEGRSLGTWEAEIDAFPTRMQHAHAAAVKLLQPKAESITLAYATFTTAAEVEAYLDELRARIMSRVNAGIPAYVQGT